MYVHPTPAIDTDSQAVTALALLLDHIDPEVGETLPLDTVRAILMTVRPQLDAHTEDEALAIALALAEGIPAADAPTELEGHTDPDFTFHLATPFDGYEVPFTRWYEVRHNGTAVGHIGVFPSDRFADCYTARTLDGNCFEQVTHLLTAIAHLDTTRTWAVSAAYRAALQDRPGDYALPDRYVGEFVAWLRAQGIADGSNAADLIAKWKLVTGRT